MSTMNAPEVAVTITAAAAVEVQKFMVAENWTSDRQSLMKYVGSASDPAFHMTLNFPLLRAFTRLDAAAARELWMWDAQFPQHAWLGTFVSNHDLAADRPGTNTRWVIKQP